MTSHSWAAIVSPSQAYISPIDWVGKHEHIDLINPSKIIRVFEPSWADLIQTRSWEGRQLLVLWPNHRKQMQQKVTDRFRECNFLIASFEGKHAEMIASRISYGLRLLDKCGIPLTDEIYRCLIAMESRAEEAGRAILHLDQAGVPLTKEALDTLVLFKKEIFQISSWIPLMYESGIGLTLGNLQLVKQDPKAEWDLFLALDLLVQSGIKPEKHHFLLLALHPKKAIKLSEAIRRLLYAKIPLTNQLTQLFGEYPSFSEKISLIIFELHKHSIRFTPEISSFVIQACKDFAAEKKQALANFDPDSPLVPELFSDSRHSLAICIAIIVFHGEEAIPQELSSIFAHTEAHAAKMAHRLLRANVSLSKRMYASFALNERGALQISKELLDFIQKGVPFTSEAISLVKQSISARQKGLASAIEYLNPPEKDQSEKLLQYAKRTELVNTMDSIMILHDFEIPLSNLVQTLISNTLEVRIETAGRLIESPLFSKEHCKTLAHIGTFPYMTDFAIQILESINVELTEDIQTFLVDVNRAHVNSFVLQQGGASPFTRETIDSILSTRGHPYNYQTPVHALCCLRAANIPLTKETFSALACQNQDHMLKALSIIVLLNSVNALSQKLFNELLLGSGCRVHAVFERLGDFPVFSIEVWNRVLLEIVEQEWTPIANAAIGLSQSTPLPAELIGMIAMHFAPPKMTHYQELAMRAAVQVKESLEEGARLSVRSEIFQSNAL